MTDTKRVKERPILFSGEMVRAILEGGKTQTRRILKQKAIDWLPTLSDISIAGKESTGLCHYGYTGERLWVRETWMIDPGAERKLHYKADIPFAEEGYNWRPSIHMPRAASRLLLEITDVRVERLQDISRADAKAEGATKAYLNKEGYYTEHEEGTYKEGFAALWQSINGKESWEANPWVWVIEFKRIEP